MYNMIFRFLRSILLIISVCAISGCYSTPYTKMEDVSQNSFNSKRKGVVIFDLVDSYKSADSLAYNIQRLGEPDKTYRVELKLSTFWSLREDRKIKDKVLFLEPGIYYIDYVDLPPQGNYIYWLPSPGIKDTFVMYGAFEVKAGEVLSMGTVIASNSTIRHTDDNLNKIKQDLSDNNMSYLAAKVKKGRFIDKWSLVYYDKHDSRRFISSTELNKYRKLFLDAAIKQANKEK